MGGQVARMMKNEHKISGGKAERKTFLGRGKLYRGRVHSGFTWLRLWPCGELL